MGSLRDYRNLDIDWEMTPEDAVTLYLEWGNNSWHHKFQPVTSKNDYTNYFVVNTWGENPTVCLIRRNSEEARELVCLDLPENLENDFTSEYGGLKGVYAPTSAIKGWLLEKLS